MPLSLRKEDMTIHPRGVIYLILFVVLCALVQATAGGNIKMAVVVIILPVAAFVLLAGVQNPMVSFVLYCIITCYFQALYRYTQIEGLSVMLSICLAICLLSIIMNKASRRQTFNMEWKNAFNVLSIGYFVWVIFMMLENFASYVKPHNLSATVVTYITLPLSYLLCCLLLNTPKKLRWTLILLGIYVVTAALKLLWQKRRGWDSVEIQFIYGGNNTVILGDGTVRYFSFFSDPGNFGGTMGLLFSAFIIPGFVLRRVWLRLFCLFVAILAMVGVIMSGTRGAIVIPFVAVAMFVLLSKNATAIVTSLVAGILTFCFFYFTNIGDDNSFIRRVRTAFRPNEDASYNVRLDNQKRIAYYLTDKPFGLGSGHVVDTKQLMDLEEDFIPTDSALVDIWVANGIVGLCVFLVFMGIVILRCCYVLLFKVRCLELRYVLSGLLGAVCGLLVNAYVGRTMNFVPSTLLVPLFLSFILNGPYIEKQLKPGESI